MTAVTPTAGETTWVVGLDLDRRSRGALVLADWLARAGDRVIGVHVLEAWARPHLRKDPISAVREMLTVMTGELGLGPLARVSAVEAARAEDGLAHAVEPASGLVIGRAARSDSEQYIRLGVVARQLLRRLPAPVIVVPPDLVVVGPGPVLLATDLGPASEAAVDFARTLAAKHGRALELVHVGEPRHNDLIDELEPAWLAARDAYHRELADELADWAATHDLAAAPRHVVYGDPASRIAAVASERQAALVVVGSRRLGLAARAFLSSTASALAGMATGPVAVVPLH